MGTDNKQGDDELIDELETLIGDPELAELERRLSEFNVFEALGVVRQELTHSNFLAFVLDPAQNHGLGDRFLKGFLDRAVRGGAGSKLGLSSIDVDLFDLAEAEVYREWHDIDIFVLDRRCEIALIIENKIDSGLHSDQLNRYFQLVEHYYPGYRIAGIYLTPSGTGADDSRFLTVGYNEIANLLDDLISTSAHLGNRDVETLTRHYVSLLRRHILGKQDIAELCSRLYRRHRRALDEIFKARLDRVAWIADLLKTLIRADASLALDDGDKGYIRFAPLTWDAKNWLDEEKTWTSTGRILLFEFANWPLGLKFKLLIGPGPKDIRQRLLDTATAKQPPFKVATKTLNQKWNTIYSRDFAPARLLEHGTDDEVREHVEKQWVAFKDGDLTSILATIS